MANQDIVLEWVKSSDDTLKTAATQSAPRTKPEQMLER
jgi:hypothetical protein